MQPRPKDGAKYAAGVASGYGAGGASRLKRIVFGDKELFLAAYPLPGSMISFSRVFRSTKLGIPFLKTLTNCNENNIK